MCTSGSLPTIDGAHKCTICKTPVHALPSCSSHNDGDETLRVCLNCTEVNRLKILSVNHNEIDARKQWNRKQKKKLKSNSYLLPNPH